jgi:hypothetical protein
MFRGIQISTIRIPLVVLAVLIAETGHAQTAGKVGAMLPVAALATNDPIRQAAQPVGLLRALLPDGSIRTCTTAIISNRFILTASRCAVDPQSLTAIFGQGQDTERFFVLTPRVEIDQARDYAVLEVEGTPSRKFGIAKLLLRIPLKGESAFVFGMNDEGQQTVARNCSVLGTNERGLILHDCDTTGNNGALLFSPRELAILGLHIGSDGQLNQASGIYSIALASDLIRDIATIKPVINFKTVGNRPNEIASDFKRLYLALHNDGRLPFKSYQVSNFSGIEDVFRSNQLFHGRPFPIELDSIACDVNPSVCTRERTEPTPEELKSGRAEGPSRPAAVGWWRRPRPCCFRVSSLSSSGIG